MKCPYCGQDTIRWDEEQNCWHCPWCGDWPDEKEEEKYEIYYEENRCKTG